MLLLVCYEYRHKLSSGSPKKKTALVSGGDSATHRRNQHNCYENVLIYLMDIIDLIGCKHYTTMLEYLKRKHPGG